MTNENSEWQIPPEGPEESEAVGGHYSHLPLEDQVPALVKDLEEAQQEASQNLDLAQRARRTWSTTGAAPTRNVSP